MTNLCKRNFTYTEFLLDNETFILDVNNNYITKSYYKNIDNNNKLQITTTFEGTNNKDKYIALLDITYFVSDTESNNTLISTDAIIPDIEEIKNDVHSILVNYVFKKKIITSKLLINKLGPKSIDFIQISENNTFSIKPWINSNKKYLSTTISKINID